MHRSVRVFASVLLALVASACSGDDEAAPATTLPAGVGAFESDVVEFSTPDGAVLVGTEFSPGDEGGGTEGIVLAHMRGADRSTWTPFAEVAAGHGFHVLTFDFRGYGDSDGERDTDLDVDLTAAVGQLEDSGVESVVVMGASMGGTATINVASELDLAGAVSLSAPAEFQGLPALDVADDVEEPLLLVVAEDDQPYAGAAESMAQIAPDNRLETLDGSAHGTNLFSEHGDDLTIELLTFAGDPGAST